MLTTAIPTHCILYGRDHHGVTKAWCFVLSAINADWFTTMINDHADRSFPSLSIALV